MTLSISTNTNTEVISGLSSDQNRAVKVYPNPSKDYVYISASERMIEQVLIYDSKGGLVHEKSVNDYEAQLSIDQLKSGNYILYLKGKDLNEVIKLVKE